VEELTGGRINVLNHITKLLKNHPVFNWSNYGIAWEVDHIIPFKKMNKLNVTDYFRINNWANLRPRLPEKNKRPEQWQDEDDSEDEESQSLDAPGEESQTLNAPAEKESECY
jgi:hypothetical protein